MDSLNLKNDLVNNRESTTLEFKKTFQKTQKEYIRTICAFANNQWWKIIFWVEDKPRKPVWLKSNKYKDFNDYDPKELSNQINNYLSENINFSFSEFTQNINWDDKIFWVLTIKESDKKPIICTSNDTSKKLREWAIYYRYNWESKEIKSQDLLKLIQEERNKEKKLFLDHIAKISKIWVHNAGVFSYDWELFAWDKKIVLDKNIIDKIKFIKEWNFVEKKWAPAIILKWEINNIESLEVVKEQMDPNITHPFEWLESVKNEILKDENIDFKERNTSRWNTIKDWIFISSKNRIFALTYLILRIKNKLNIENDINFCWHNEKKTIFKYSNAFINKCTEYIKDENKLNEILK